MIALLRFCWCWIRAVLVMFMLFRLNENSYYMHEVRWSPEHYSRIQKKSTVGRSRPIAKRETIRWARDYVDCDPNDIMILDDDACAPRFTYAVHIPSVYLCVCVFIWHIKWGHQYCVYSIGKQDGHWVDVNLFIFWIYIQQRNA